MLFNSIPFLLFLPLVFAIYWILGKKNLNLQNLFLLLASYFFYACWNWHFLFLLLFSTGLDYFTAIKIHESKIKRNKQFWFWISIGINLGFLGVFKYYNFFTDSLVNLLSTVGVQANLGTLNVILPVGISFYTFHGLSYVIDIYNDKIKPEKNIVSYSLFVTYFPLLVAGPIERATHLLPQIKKKRIFDYGLAIEGVQQIIWGFFKKIVVADNCAFFTNQIFENNQNYSSSELIAGAVLFAFQIYGDFSGYSDIALGTSKLFGIRLLRNFNFPYFSKDIADFWRRWHISLSSWFKDYLYMPLGGSKGSLKLKIRNTFIIFLVSGFWHGANWTYIIWGAIHAILFLPLLLANKNRSSLESNNYQWSDFLKIITTFSLVCLAWIFFRSNTISEAISYIIKMLSFKDLSLQFFYKNMKYILLSSISLFSILILIWIEWQNVKRNNFEIKLSKTQLYICLLVIFFMGSFKNQLSFIYFQF